MYKRQSKQNSTDTTVPLIRGYNREREADAVARRILAYVESSPEAQMCIRDSRKEDPTNNSNDDGNNNGN